MPLVEKIRAAKQVHRFTREARLGLALEVSEYAKVAKQTGNGNVWEVAKRAYVSSIQQMGNAPQMTWQQDAKWTKF